MENIEFTTEQMQLLQDVVEKIQEIIETIKEIVVDIIKQIAKAFSDVWDAFVISVYANGKVKHLCLHAKKHRTRKKNLHRITKDFMKLLSG